MQNRKGILEKIIEEKKMPKFRCPIASITLMIFEVGFKRQRLILMYFHRLLRVCLIFADS